VPKMGHENPLNFSYLQYLKGRKMAYKDPDWVMRVPIHKISETCLYLDSEMARFLHILVPKGLAMRNDMLWTMLSILVSLFLGSSVFAESTIVSPRQQIRMSANLTS